MSVSLARISCHEVRLVPQRICRRAFLNIRHNSNTVVSEAEQQNLTWPEYLEIRKSKRKWETAATIPACILGLMGGLAYFGSLESDSTKPIMGLDPLFFYSGCTVSCMGLGYLIGPAIGAAGWRMTHRRAMNLIEAKDRRFHQHIVKNRVDPTAQSATNPVPDFYGEKIGSLTNIDSGCVTKLGLDGKHGLRRNEMFVLRLLSNFAPYPP